MATAMHTHPFQRDRESLARPLADPAMTFDLDAELEALRGESAWEKNRHNARTLAKYADLRIVLATAKAGVRMKAHEPNERIAVHVLRGHVRLLAGDDEIEVRAGQLAALDKALVHDIEAVEESAFLIHVSWPSGV
jgi:quercetin dioxygenase-like cupin family protein